MTPQTTPRTRPETTQYAFGPFVFSSALVLPELSILPPGPQPGPGLIVDVMLGRVPEAIAEPTFTSTLCSASPNELLLTVPDIAWFYVRDGHSITVQPAPQASPLDIRAFLLGNIFAVLCHQRRLLPLHASAVRMGDGVLAFLGDSGAGKSTLAASLAKAGYSLVSDDICLLDPAAPLDQRVLPVAPWLKLWRTSLEALGQPANGLAQVFSKEDKFRLPTLAAPDGQSESAPVVESNPLPLRAIVMLERRPVTDGNSVGLTLLPPVKAITQMMRFTYQGYLLRWLGLQGEHFTQCGRGLEGAEAYTCERAWTFDSLPEVQACLEQTFG